MPAAETISFPHNRTIESMKGDVDRTIATRIVAIASGMVTKTAATATQAVCSIRRIL
jgi:hypothetical protein